MKGTTAAAGKLPHRLTFQAPAQAALASGERVASWADLLTAWAAVEPLAGRELWQARQVSADVTHAITVRDGVNRRAITGACRARWGLRVFQLESPTRPQELAGGLLVFQAHEAPAEALPANPLGATGADGDELAWDDFGSELVWE